MNLILYFAKRNLSLTYKDNIFYGDTTLKMYASSLEPVLSFIESPDFDFSPNHFYLEVATQVFESVITPNANTPTIEGVYNYTLYVETYTGEKEVFYINLNVPGESEPELPDTIKYLTEYKDLNGTDFRLEIWEKGFKGLTTNVRGTANLKYQSKKDLFEPIIASSLTIYYEATPTLSMNDLYSEEEQTFKVIFKRNGNPIFIGFIKPDGIFEDWVSNRWILDIDAIDGLSTLKNLSFVTDNGNFYIGRMSILDVMKNCLHRTGLDLPINVCVDLDYEGKPLENYTILEDVFVSTERYYQDSKNVMDCESVLKSLLQIFNATVIQQDGEWWIFRSIDIKETTFFTRYVDGIYSNQRFYNPSQTIGSHINEFSIIHCNENQKKSIDASVQAHRIYYKYGNASNILKNGNLTFDGTGLNLDGWTVNQVGNEVQRLGVSGLVSESVNYGDDVDLINLNQDIDIAGGDVMVFTVDYSNDSFNTGGLMFSIGVGGQWFNLKENKWQGYAEMNLVLNTEMKVERFAPAPDRYYYYGRGNAQYQLTIQAPADGKLHIKIWRDQAPSGAYGGHLGGKFSLFGISVVPESNSNKKGVYYTGQRTSRISSVTKDNVTVYNGDSNSSLYVGTLYKSDQTTGTEKWKRVGRDESLELLEINAEDNLRISPRPMIVFEGDIFGYISYLSLISINNINGKFLPIDYTFKTAENIIQLRLKEFSSDYLDAGTFKVEREDDFGNETKVTIKS